MNDAKTLNRATLKKVIDDLVITEIVAEFTVSDFDINISDISIDSGKSLLITTYPLFREVSVLDHDSKRYKKCVEESTTPLLEDVITEVVYADIDDTLNQWKNYYGARGRWTLDESDIELSIEQISYAPCFDKSTDREDYFPETEITP